MSVLCIKSKNWYKFIISIWEKEFFGEKAKSSHVGHQKELYEGQGW